MAARRLAVLGALALVVVAQQQLLQRPFVLPSNVNLGIDTNSLRYAALADVEEVEEVGCVNEEVRVPLTLGVMSRCPDAIFCEAVIDDVLAEVGDIVDVGLTFIGQPNASEPDWGVTCKHGAGECLGNVLELCAISIEPPRPDEIELTWRPRWWDFTLCMNAAGKDHVGERIVAQVCATKAGIDWALLDDCKTNGEGKQLLLESVQATKALEIVNSCTVVLNGRKVCVRDDNKWRDCEDGSEVEDFVRQIEDEYAALNELYVEDEDKNDQ